MTCTSGLTAVDQAGVMLEERFAIAARGINRILPIDGCEFLEGATMSMSRFLARVTAGLVLAVLFLLAGCGGGGGGGDGPPPPPPGNPSPAVVTTANASKLTANVTGSGQTVGIIGGVSVESGDATQNRGSGLMDLARRLSRIFRDAVVRAEQTRSAQRPVTAVIPVEQTDPCDAGQGSVHFSGTLNDNGTGTLQVTFINCLVIRDKDGNPVTNDTINLNGSATLRVDAAVVDVVTSSVAPTDFTLSFASLTLRALGLSIDAGGTLRTQLSSGTTETITANLVSLDNITTKTTRTENLMIVNVYDNLDIPSFFNATVNGRVYDQDHGYVDITTPAPLFFGTLTQLFPSSGQILLTGAPAGAGNLRIRATAFSATLVDLELDLTGGGFPVGKFARLKWTDLTGPVGADLGDTDNDGMHNSWETVNGLNLAVNDALGDKDLDSTPNINEYLAGTVP